MDYHADPGIFGLAAATCGFARSTTTPRVPLGPPDPPDEYEPIAPYCNGPGHLLDTDEQGFDVRVEDCPACVGKIRNHRTVRTVEAVEERAS